MKISPQTTSPRFSDVVWTVAATLLAAFLHLLLLAVLARVLAPEELGLIALANVVISIALLFSDCGISSYVIYAQSSTPLQQSSLYWFNLALGSLAALAVILAAPALAGVYSAPALAELLYVSAAIFPVFTLGSQFQAQLSKRLLLSTVARIDIVSRGLAFFTSVVFAYTGFGPMSFVLGQLAGAGLRSCAMFLACREHWRPTLEFEFRGLRPALRFAGFNTSGQLINRLATDVDVLLIGRLIDVSSLGIYSLAKELAFGVLRLVTTVASRLGIPMLAAQQSSTESLTRGYARVLDVVSVSSAVLFSGLILLSPWLIPLVYGEQYTEVSVLFSMLAVVALLRSLGNVHGVLIVATGRVHLDLVWNVLVIVITAPAIYLAALQSLESVILAILFIQASMYFVAYPILVRGAVTLSFARFLKPFTVALALALGALLLVKGFHV